MASVRDENRLSSYRKLLIQLSLNLSSKDLEMLKFAAVDVIPRGQTENIGSGLHFFDVLEQDIKIGPRNLSLLQDMLHTIGRVDLEERIQSYLTAFVDVESDGKLNLMIRMKSLVHKKHNNRSTDNDEVRDLRI